MVKQRSYSLREKLFAQRVAKMMATTRNEAAKEFLVAYAKAGIAVILSQIYDGQHYPLYFLLQDRRKKH